MLQLESILIVSLSGLGMGVAGTDSIWPLRVLPRFRVAMSLSPSVICGFLEIPKPCIGDL